MAQYPDELKEIFDQVLFIIFKKLNRESEYVVPIVKQLVHECGADPHQVEPTSGLSPLCSSTTQGTFQAVEKAMDEKIIQLSPGLLDLHLNKDGLTLLHHAVSLNRDKFVIRLVEHLLQDDMMNQEVSDLAQRVDIRESIVNKTRALTAI